MALHLATYTLLFLSISSHFDAYVLCCVCKAGLPDSSLRKAVEQACGRGAECAPIMKRGACYAPKTAKNHYDYAVNTSRGRIGAATSPAWPHSPPPYPGQDVRGLRWISGLQRLGDPPA